MLPEVALQPFVLISAAVGAVLTFYFSEQTKTRDRAEERSQPFFKLQLALYAEASRVAASIASIRTTNPDYAKDATYKAAVTRFWELYWGELSLVESTPTDEDKYADCMSVERLMAKICTSYVSPDNKSLCQTRDSSKQPEPVDLAITLAHHIASEVKNSWLKDRVEAGKACIRQASVPADAVANSAADYCRQLKDAFTNTKVGPKPEVSAAIAECDRGDYASAVPVLEKAVTDANGRLPLRPAPK